MIDNHDSFTYNVVHYLRELGAEVKVVKNDELTVAEIDRLNPDRIVISPGPCAPDDAGISLGLITHFAGRCPILGICLGHQCIAEAFGASIVRARRVMHGKTSAIYHDRRGLFEALDNPFVATRYHSLSVELHTLPDELEVSAWTRNENGKVDEIMGLRHRELPLEGVQFHPESILSEHGHRLLSRFLAMPAPGAGLRLKTVPSPDRVSGTQS